MENAYGHDIDTVLDVLDATEAGLSDKQAAERLAKYGPNAIKQKPPKKVIAMVLEHLTDAMVIILLAAAGLSVILREWTEAIVILAIVIVDTTIGVIQEKKAADAVAALKNLTALKAKALRQGEESLVAAVDLVPGDIVILEQGVIVPADLRLIDSNNLKIQESALTGESEAVEKDSDLVMARGVGVGDRKNMAFSSTIVTYGTGVGVVVETGMNTEVGSIARILDNEDEMDTPMKQKLNRVGKVLSVAGIIIAAVIFGIGMLYGRPMIPLLMTAISLAISVIPEGLPATATIVMALGVERMAKQNALVRSLPAIETLGSATVICTDKTGTLTKNQMTVTRVAMAGDFALGRGVDVSALAQAHPKIYGNILNAAALCNNATEDPDKPGTYLGDPTESALIVFAEKFGIDQIKYEKKFPRMFEQPFDSRRKRMSTINQMSNVLVAYTKGSVEGLLRHSAYILDERGTRPITKTDKENILKLANTMSEKALRVLGYAMRKVDKVPNDDAENIEEGMIFVGLTGMIDPPRKEVIGAIKTCHEAGIRVVMITGDHAVTAMAIARQLDIYREGDLVVSGDELAKMGEHELDKKISNVTVFARVSPSDKLRIVKSLQRKKEVVAMTGDGVNDSPALKAANIGVAMGATGTDVAKDASDLILLNDNFTTIEYAIREGRRVYRNIQKVIQFLLSGNIAEVLTLFVATLFNWEPPILAVHILVINLVTDTLPALALGVDPADKSIMKEQPVRGGSLFGKGLVGRVLSNGVFIFAATLGAYAFGLSTANYAVAMTMAFAVLGISQLFHAFSQRSNIDSVFTRGQKQNVYLFLSALGSLVILAAMLFLPPLQNFFSLTFLNLEQWGVVMAASVVPFAAVEVVKLVKRGLRRIQST
ncbi:MAG: cation-translocating P-type ATPase [Candidatus Saccharimonadales bacterium]